MIHDPFGLITDIFKAFQLIDKGPFCHLLTYLRPLLLDNDIPHCQTLYKKIINKANISKSQLKSILEVRPITLCKCLKYLFISQDVPSKVSFTFDAWTLQVDDPYLSITGHFINGARDSWKLHSEQLAFTPLPSHHSGANIGNAIMCIVDHYGLQGKVHAIFLYL